ncbi:MFS transporter [Chitinophaga sp. MM2321]|uniref:MFS transporter n=1 Tax=Chitinophaga sp. MM2321 TaxID=3137178 RepID=UPI0032D57F81
MQAINRSQLFWASCLALLVTSLSFGIRAGILNELGTGFQLSTSQLSSITATAFWGFPLAVIIGGMIVDLIGMKRLLVMAFIFHLLGIILTVQAQGYWSLFISTLLIGIANGTVEAACNPLVTTLYPENKVAKLNHFHLWFPGGIVLGTLIVLFFSSIGLGWKVQVGFMILPTLVYGYLFSRLKFPVTERVSSGISTASMYKSVTSPLFIFMFICMFGTAITELFTGQWIDVLLKNVTDNAILILTLTTGVMVIGRGLAGPIMRRFSPEAVLLMSAVVSTIGLYLLSTLTGNAIFFSAIVFGIGVCYFWPTMLGFISENIPTSGAFGMNLMGGAGMLAVTAYTLLMGKFYDNLVLNKLPAGADLTAYLKAEPGTENANLLYQAKSAAGPEVLSITLIIPVILIVAFTGLFFYMRAKNKKNVIIFPAVENATVS